MRPWVALSALGLLPAVLTAQTGSSGTAVGSRADETVVTGFVLDNLTRTPVPDAMVVVDLQGPGAVTDREGRFRIEVPSSWRGLAISITAQHPRYWSTREPLVVFPGENTAHPLLRPKAYQDGGGSGYAACANLPTHLSIPALRYYREEGPILAGFVVDCGKAGPAAGATVSLDGFRMGTATDSTGYFQLRLPEPMVGRDVSFLVDLPGAVPRSRSFTVAPGVNAFRVLTSAAAPTLEQLCASDVGACQAETRRLESASALTGSVTDEVTHAPLTDFRLTVNDSVVAPLLWGESGYLVHLPDRLVGDSVVLGLEREGYRAWVDTMTVGRGGYRVDIALVTEEEAARREASEAGRRQCELVGSGQYQIPPPPSDTLPPWILGRVTDAGSGDPLPAAQVYLTLGRHGALTSASGCFRFELPREVVGERVEVRTDYLGYHSRSDTIRVAPAGNLFLVELERAPIQLDIGGDVHPGSTRSLDSTTAAPRPRPVRHGVPGEGLRSPGDVEPTLRSLHRCTRLVDGIQSTHPDSWAAVLGRVEDRADGSPIHRAQITSTTVPTTVTTWADGCFLLEFPDSLIGRSVPFEVEAIDYHPSVDSLVVPDGLAMRRVELNRALAPLPCWEAARCADSTAPAARTRAERSVDEADRMLARRDFGRLLEEARAECSTAIRELMADTLSRPDDPPMLLGRVTERGHRVQHYPVIVEGVSEPLWTRGNGCFNLRATLPDSLVGRRIEILFNQIGYLARAVGLVVGPGSNVIDVPLRAVALTMCGSIEGSCDPPSRSPEAPRVRAWEPRPVVTAPPAPGSVVLMGRVLDDVTGVSLSGVVVSVDDRGESTLSDSSGGFRLFLPPSDSRTEATVRAQYDGYWSASSRVALVAQSAEVDLRIRPAPHTDADGPRSGGCLTVHRLEALSMDRAPRGEAPFVSGTVTECGASTPLEGATAHMDDLGLAAVGDPRGYFRIDLQSEHVGRAARLTVRAPGHVATSVRFLIGSGGNVLMLALPVHRPGPMEACGADPGPCAADGVADTSLPLLAGTLVDARTGTPISDVPTFLDSTRLRPHATGGGGYLVHLPKGSVGTAVPVRFEHPLYETLTEHRTILPGENRLDRALTSIADRIEDYAANARRECVERAVSRYAYVRGSGPPVLVGRVEDPTSRQGLPHTQIWIEGQRTGTLSDHVGCFVLSPGERTAGDEIELRAQCISSGSWTRVFRLEPGLTEVVVGLECREIPADDVSENH